MSDAALVPVRRRRIAPLIALAVAVVVGALFVVLAGSDAGRDESAESSLLGRPAPRVVSTLLGGSGAGSDGTVFDLSRRKGSWVVLNFFDPDCVPCIREHSELVALDEQQRSLGATGAELYTIINKGTDDAVRTWFAENGGSWPVVRDPEGKISVAFGVSLVPETWIIDPYGFVRRRFIGQVTAAGVGTQLQQLRETMS